MNLTKTIHETEYNIEYSTPEDELILELRLQEFTSYYEIIAKKVTGEFHPNKKTLFLIPETEDYFIQFKKVSSNDKIIISSLTRGAGFITTINKFDYVIGKAL